MYHHDFEEPNTKAKVITLDGEYCRAILSAPYLFAIVFIMRKTYVGREKELGFLHRRRSRRNAAITVTDLDFADDLAILTEEIEQAQNLLQCLETEAESV